MAEHVERQVPRIISVDVCPGYIDTEKDIKFGCDSGHLPGTQHRIPCNVCMGTGLKATYDRYVIRSIPRISRRNSEDEDEDL